MTPSTAQPVFRDPAWQALQQALDAAAVSEQHVLLLGEAGIECEWRNPNDVIEEPLSSRTYVQTTRILREAISNTIKHSSASHVIISADVDLEHHVFTLVIQDNGKGIPMELDGRLDRGHGMTSMKHRAKQLNGQCLVESGPGFGTVIRLTLPLEIATMQQVLSHRLGS